MTLNDAANQTSENGAWLVRNDGGRRMGPKGVLLAVYVRLRYAESSAAYLSCPSPVIHND
jgi:hypothetical protein